MKILKLPWLQHREEHKNYEVYTCDVSPDSTRLATGGLDGKIRIWSIADIMKFGADSNTSLEDRTIMQPLCTMSRHAGSVTTVKFSPDGKYLASGSDDRVLLIWEIENAPVQPVFGSESTDREHWNVRRRLVAHDNDIQDICWAPDSSIMVSVGLDRAIIIWNGSTFEKIKRFDVHQSHVKGVVFDPANKYFATASDDRTIRMFRYHKAGELSFSVEHVITEPFEGSPLTTYFRRLSWSPDGQHIAAPNAMNGPVSTVAIIDRGTWASSVSLVGHDQPTEVVCFNPRIFKRTVTHKGDDDKEKNHSLNDVDCIVASSGQDKTLALWSTFKARPLVVAYDICSKSVTDMAWTPDGSMLFLSSLDSTIIAIMFAKNELGEAIPLDKNIEYLHRYGVDKDSLVFPEDIDQLILEDEARKFKRSKTEMNLLEDRLMIPGTLSQPNILKARSQKKQKLEKPEPVVNMVNPTAVTESQVNILQVKRRDRKTGQITVLNQPSLKNGKKRVAPTLVSVGYSPTKKEIQPQSVLSGAGDQQKTTKEEKLPLTLLQETKLSKSSFTIPRLGMHTLIMGGKERNRQSFYEHNNEEELNQLGKLQTHDVNGTEEINKLTLNAKNTIEKIWKEEPNTRYLEYHNIVPDADAVLREMGDSKSLYILEIRNGVERSIQFDTEALFENPTRIIGYHDGQRSFELFFPEVVLSCVGSSRTYTWILATATGQIYFMDTNGQLKVPRISLGHKIIRLAVRGEHVIAITESALVYVWNLTTMVLVHKQVPLLPLLARDPIQGSKVRFSSKIRSITLEGLDIDVTMSSETNSELVERFRYSKDLGCWTA